MKRLELALENEDVLIWAAVSTQAQDKYSIEDQLRLCREWCVQHNARIVDELTVRGFSRDYWTLADVVAASTNDPDMVAFAKLQAHIRKRSFTVFLCYDADRFGRTQSLVHEVIGRITRDCGARIYTLFDRVWMDEENAPMIGTLKAYKAQQDVSRLREYRAVGMDNRARNGKSTSAEMPLFHKRVRDDSGAEVAVVVNEELRSLWTDVAIQILRGTSWNKMERVLFENFGHGNNGKPYRPFYMHDLVTSPGWWGHAALNYRRSKNKSTKEVHPWIWDESVAPPPEITVYRNRLPAVYSGKYAELGEQVKKELWRRYKLRGRATAANTFRFHGLLVCDKCGYTLTMTVGNPPRRPRYVRCATFYDHRYGSRGASCDQRGYITLEYIQEYLTPHIENKLKNLPDEIFDFASPTEAIRQRVKEETARLEKLKKRHEFYYNELPEADNEGRVTLREKIKEASQQISSTKEVLDVLNRQLLSTHDFDRAQADALKTIRDNGGVEWLWAQGDTFTHQILSAMLGTRQLVVRDKEIIGTLPTENPILLKKRLQQL